MCGSSTTEVRRKTLDNNSIDDATLGLTPDYRKRFTKLSEDNALTVADYIVSLKSESDGLSDNYRRSIIKVLTMFSIFCKNKPFDDVTREDFLCFLDMFRKPESIDPMHMWVGTYKWMDGETARARSKLLKMHGIHAIQSM